VDTSTELDHRVFQFVADETGHPLRNVVRGTTLTWEIGLAGDDAVEFLQKFIKQFNIDPESFRTIDFGRHFGNQDAHLQLGCVLFVVGVPLAFLIENQFGAATWFASCSGCFLAYLIWTGWALICTKWPPPDPSAITVGDLIDAARAGRWTADK
jgi:hypothetical protein